MECKKELEPACQQRKPVPPDRFRKGEKRPVGPPCDKCGEPVDYAKQYGCPVGFDDCPNDFHLRAAGV